MPISVSHALIGGLIGPAILKGGTVALIRSGITKVLSFIVVAPVLGIVLGFLIMIVVMIIFQKDFSLPCQFHFPIHAVGFLCCIQYRSWF